MKHATCSILFLFILFPGMGQVFFNNIYGAPNTIEISTNIEVLDSTYLQLSSYSEDNQLYLLSREIDQNGVELNAWSSSLGESTFFPLNLAESMYVNGEGVSVWASSRQNNGVQGYALQFNKDVSNVEWEYVIPWTDTFKPQFNMAHELSDGNSLLIGEFWFDINGGSGLNDGTILLYTVNSNGDLIHDIELDLIPGKTESIRDVIKLSNGNLLLSGQSTQPIDNFSLEITPEGQVVWFQTWGNPEVHDWLPQAVQTSDSTIQYIYSYGLEEDPLLIFGTLSDMRTATFNTNTQTFSEETVLTDTLYGGYLGDCVQHHDGSVFCTGYSYEYGEGEPTYGYGWVMKLSPDFELEWFNKYYHYLSEDYPTYDLVDQFYDIEIALDGGLICQGGHWHFDTEALEETYTAWTVKLDVCGNLEWEDCEPIVNVAEPHSKPQLVLYPNPTTGTLQLQAPQPLTHVTVFTPTGQQVLEWDGNNPRVALDLGQLAAGAYVVVGELESGVVREWVVVE